MLLRDAGVWWMKGLSLRICLLVVWLPGTPSFLDMLLKMEKSAKASAAVCMNAYAGRRMV